MKIYRPVFTNRITQKFGENKLPIYKQAGMLGHNGYDLTCWYGEPVFHSADFPGIAQLSADPDGGLGIDIVSEKPFEDGYYRKIRYWHLKKFLVAQGQIIRPGILIGLGDSTGNSTGNHVHLGLKRCEQNGAVLDRDNGYRGGIDLMPYFINEFILEQLNIQFQLGFFYWIKSKLTEF